MWVSFYPVLIPLPSAVFACAMCSHTGRRMRHTVARKRQSDDAAKWRTHYRPYYFPCNLAKYSHINKKKAII